MNLCQIPPLTVKTALLVSPQVEDFFNDLGSMPPLVCDTITPDLVAFDSSLTSEVSGVVEPCSSQDTTDTIVINVF